MLRGISREVIGDEEKVDYRPGVISYHRPSAHQHARRLLERGSRPGSSASHADEPAVSEMSNQTPKGRVPGRRVFPPKLTLIKLEERPSIELLPPVDDEVKEMLRQMRERLKETSRSATDDSDTPEAA